MQIRTRLTLLFLLIAACVLAAVLFFAYALFKNSTEETFFQGLRTKANMTAGTALRDASAMVKLPSNWLEPDDGPLPYSDNISIFNDNYERVFSLHPEVAPVPLKTIQDAFTEDEVRFTYHNLHVLSQSYRAANGNRYVIVVEGYCDVSPLQKLRNILVISFLIGLILMAISGWVMAGQALHPLSQMMNEVDAIQTVNLAQRIGIRKNKDELQRLALTFNRLLERVERAFQAQRMFISNVSHELKNPINILRTQVDVVLQRKRDAHEYEQVLHSLSEDLHHISDLEEKLLQLSRMHSSPETIAKLPIRLDELLWQVCEQLLKRNPDAKCSLDLQNMPDDSEDTLYVHGNEALLRTAFLNIAENAVKYAADRSVQIRARFQSDGHHTVWISDRGSGIPAHELPLIFEPFFRSTQHRQVKGSGIGLSLVKSIFNLHQITIGVNSSATEGTTFNIQF
jgi:signal transduction histidine kinase